MHLVLLIASVLVLICIFSSKLLYRFGVPSLLLFLVLGMVMGSDGIGGIAFDDFNAAEHLSSVAIVIIIFFGGFGTKWDTAKPSLVKAGLMSSLGTVITAVVIGLLCALVMGVPVIYGLLFGAVVSSTDAASVFSILRSRKLSLKDGLAPLLEVESGSNDPFSYIMTILVVSVIASRNSGAASSNIFVSFIMQVGIAVAIGAVMSFLTVVLMKRIQLQVTGFYPILLLAIVMLGYSLCVLLNGNGLLFAYILGIVVGNNKILRKISLVHFFDSLSWIMQIMLFFTLGLLSFPSELPEVFLPGTLLSILLIVAARPIATFSILSWFRIPLKQRAFISWVGLRGSASIVFAIAAVQALGNSLPYDLFHLVFYVALFSILIQGTLTPFMAKKLGVVDEAEENAVMKTFNDYTDETHSGLLEYRINANDSIAGKRIVDSNIPESILIIMIKRDGEIFVPKGSTLLKENDVVVMSGDDFSFFDKWIKR